MVVVIGEAIVVMVVAIGEAIVTIIVVSIAAATVEVVSAVVVSVVIIVEVVAPCCGTCLIRPLPLAAGVVPAVFAVLDVTARVTTRHVAPFATSVVRAGR